MDSRINDKDCSLMIEVFRLKKTLISSRVVSRVLKIVSSGWSLVPAVLGTISSIPIGSSISLEGFSSSILLVVVIIVMVVIVVVILIVVIVVIVGVVIVVMIFRVVVVVDD
ncbi:hypothetical protein Tco_1495679, partial [Tanacetum coccineum]